MPHMRMRPRSAMSTTLLETPAVDADEDLALLSEDSEFVCYGDRVCFLCEGQLLALTRKFNLTYEQMALFVATTIVSGGLLGVAALLAWRKGMLRKRYAALQSHAIYDEDALYEDKEPESKQRRSSNTDDSDASKKKGDEHVKAIAFRLFEYDSATRAISFASVGKPVRFGVPLIVVHADTHRAIRYKSHRGNVTISKPPINLHFQKQLLSSIEAVEASAVRRSHQRPQSMITPGYRFSQQPKVSRPATVIGGLDLPQAPQSAPLAWQNQRTSEPYLHQLTAEPPAFNRPHRSSTQEGFPRPPPPMSSSSSTRDSRQLIHSISDTYQSFVHDIQESIQRQRERNELRKRQKQLLKDMPNMSFAHRAGKYYIATVQPVTHHLQPKDPTLLNGGDDEDDYLRWGAPMALVANFNQHACGIRPREYYKDSQLYLTTETTQTTIIPLREDGDLRCMAKESTRYLAHVEKKQVQISVGTYNVWMMPRKVSMFTHVSPKKNTRARMIADVLPPCDVWVFTECFDHRARGILLDKLKSSGYFFLSPTVGHKQINRGNIRKFLNGGVVLASKYPILNVRIKLFGAACTGADKLADKGVLYCKILKDGLLVHIFSTHLQAWNDPLSRSMRRTQMKMIAGFMRSMDIDPVNDAVMVVGDMNVNFWLNKTNQEYDEMLELFDAKDPSVMRQQRRKQATDELNPDPSTRDFKRIAQYSFDPRTNALAAEGLSTDGSLELLDFVLYSASHRQPSSATSWIQPIVGQSPWKCRKKEQYNLSDHYPVVSSFTFDM